jgi:hypothetical protein
VLGVIDEYGMMAVMDSLGVVVYAIGIVCLCIWRYTISVLTNLVSWLTWLSRRIA